METLQAAGTDAERVRKGRSREIDVSSNVSVSTQDILNPRPTKVLKVDNASSDAGIENGGSETSHGKDIDAPTESKLSIPLRTGELFESDMPPASFVLRPPIKPDEVDAAGRAIREVLIDAQDRISTDGYDAYKSWVNRHLEDGADGMDSDEEAEAERTRVKLSLEDAVVRGNPRRYQTELFEIAKKRNTIVNLGTGRGKTLVALLLIRHLAESDPAFKAGKKQTWFLVPSIALAVQHRITLKANLPYTVEVACNQSSNTDKARKQLAEANIVVATHGSAMDLLNHYGDLFSFSRVNLLVVDECHYACGNHRYTHIMDRHYKTLPFEKRPRVLGLTASPFVNVKKGASTEALSSLLTTLEEMLDCTLATLPGMTGSSGGDANNAGNSDPDTDGDEASPKTTINAAEERVVHYFSPDDLDRLPTHLGLGLHESRIPEFNQLGRLYSQLGPRVVAVYSATLARECSRNKWMDETPHEFELVKGHLRTISDFCKRQCENCPTGGRTEKLAVLEELLEDIIERRSGNGGRDMGEGEGGNDDDPVGVVFVDMRITALALYDYFRARQRELAEGTWIPVSETQWTRRPKRQQQKAATADDFDDDDDEDPVAAAIRDATYVGLDDDMDDLDFGGAPDATDTDAHGAIESHAGEAGPQNHIKCEVLVRHCTQVFKYLDKNHQAKRLIQGGKDGEREKAKSVPWLHQQKKIRDVLDGMRRGQTNVLIATSIVEEGVDVAACSFVIVFDKLRSSKSYVQMKGRARRKNAKLFVFQDSHPRAQALKLTTLQAAQETQYKVQKFLEARAALGLDNKLLRQMFLPKNKYIGSSVSVEERALEEGEYRAENGVVDLSSARSLLNRYAISIPLDASAKISRERLLLHMPSCNEEATILTLPSHLPSDMRCIELPESYKEHGGNTLAGHKDRQSMLALMACVRLHSLKLLNSRLLPLRHKDMNERLLKVALTRIPAFEPVTHTEVPSHGEEEKDREVYIYPLRQSGVLFSQHDTALKGDGRTLCIVSTAPLPDKIPGLHFRHSELGHVAVELGAVETTRLSSAQWEEIAEFHSSLFNARFRKRSKSEFFRYNANKARKSVSTPHAVGVLDKNGKMDWARIGRVLRDYMRSDEERMVDITSLKLDSSSDLPEPRVVCPQYDPGIKYIAFGNSQITCSAAFPSQDIEDVTSYSDYFGKKRGHEVSSDCPLLAVQRFWHLPRRVLREQNIERLKKKAGEEEAELIELQEGERAPCDGLVSCLLPQEACMECQYLSDAHLFLHCIHLPHVLYHTDRVIQTHSFVDYCLERFPFLGKYLKDIDIEEVMSALTAKSSQLDNDYDKLEWFGDAVLKMLHTDTLLHSRELRKWVAILHEGDLSNLRCAMGSNKRLRDASRSTGIARYTLFYCLGRGQWIPSCLEMYATNEEGDEIDAPQIESVEPSDKVSADVMESLLGLIYIHFGFEASVDVAVELGISLPRDPDMATKPTPGDKDKFLALAKSLMGKDSFKAPELLEEALTHPTAIYEDVPNYQRLEWVGDAVLCLAAREYIYKKYHFLGLAEMNIIESTLVCNETLAYLCVKNGLAQHINHRDPLLPNRFQEFRRSISEGGRGLWGTDPPKVLSDVVESMFGAAHVDGGFEDGQKAVLFTLRPLIDTISAALQHGDEFNPNKYVNDIFMHPKQELHEMGGGLFLLKTWREEDFAGCQVQCPLWCDSKWGEASEQGAGSVAVVQSLGINIVSALEPNTTVAKNRACALSVFAFHKFPDLMEKLKEIKQCISAPNDNDEDED